MQEIEKALADMPINQMPSANSDPTQSVQLDASTPPASSTPSRAPVGMQLGPKYLSALEKVDSLSGIRAVSVELPILGTTVSVAPMSGQEEQEIRTSSSDPETFLNGINKILFSHSTFNNLQFESYDDFLNNFYPSDKSLMIWALLASSYSTLPTMRKQCGKCGEIYEVSLKPEDVMKPDGLPSPWDKDQNPKEFRIHKEILDGHIQFELGLPSEKDRMTMAALYNAAQIKNNINQTGNILSYVDNLTFFIKKIVIKDDQDIVLTNMVQDIYPFMSNLSPKIKDMIQDEITLTEFDDYTTTFYEDVTCDHCGNPEKIEIVPEVEFFRKALSAY